MDTLGDSTAGTPGAFDTPPEPAASAPPQQPRNAAPRRVPLDGISELGVGDAPSEDACVVSPPGAGHAPADRELAELLARTQSVAVVGMSPNVQRTSHGVAEWLLEHAHFQLFFVNPVAVGQTALGMPFYASLADLPLVPDLVEVFRRPELVAPVADEAIAVGASTLWLQLGIVNEAASATARAAGMTTVQNRCLKVEYRRLRDRVIAARAAV